MGEHIRQDVTPSVTTLSKLARKRSSNNPIHYSEGLNVSCRFTGAPDLIAAADNHLGTSYTLTCQIRQTCQTRQVSALAWSVVFDLQQIRARLISLGL
jgi:hypothetical protein